MGLESSDILGGRLDVAPATDSNSLLKTFAVLASTIIAICWVFRGYIRQWREANNRRAMRRRHGIPDNDLRPFSVAYAAANRARADWDDRRKLERLDNDEKRTTSPTSTQVSAESTTLRQRNNQIDHDIVYPTPEAVAFTVTPLHEQRRLHQTTHGLTSNGPVYEDVFTTTNNWYPGVDLLEPIQSPPAQNAPPFSTERTNGKRALEEDLDSDPEKELKKIRVENEDAVDGDEEAGRDVSEEEMDVDQESPPRPRRVSKRAASFEGDEDSESTHIHRKDKRQRKIPRDRHLERIDTEVFQVSGPPQRGKKRDRAEATFGNDSVHEADADKQHRRRRRKTGEKEVDTASRGRKRGRDADSSEGGEEDPGRLKRRTIRKSIAKQPSDISMEDGTVFQHGSCKGRRIDEEWEVNGVRYKAGPKGERLRQALVRKSSSRFHMPSDSQHPDRKANFEVYVEKWLTEAEFEAAKDRQELAWQEPATPREEPSTPGDVPDSPSVDGKTLLWSSTTKEPIFRKAPFRQSIATNLGLRLNPFQQPQLTPGRRISTQQSTPVPSTDSPKPSKTYSKWEKQDLEAAAMSKLRQKMQQEALAAQAAKITTPSPPSAPTVTFAKPTDQTTPATAVSKDTVPTMTLPTLTANTSDKTSDKKPSVPNFFANTASSNATPTAPKPANDNPLFPNPPTTVPSSSNSNAVPNFFAMPPKAPTTTLAAGPSANTAAPASQGNTSDPTSTQSTAGRPAFSIFGAANNALKPTTAQAAGTTSSTAPPQSAFGFQSSSSSLVPAFGPSSASQPNRSEPEKSSQSSGAPPGGSLLSRLGPPPNNAGASQPSPTPASGTSAFNKSPFNFSTAAAAPKPESSSNSTPEAAPAVPKFNFGFSKPVGSSAPDTSTAPSGASSALAPAADASKPSAATFNFAAPSKPTTSTESSSQPMTGFASYGSTSTNAFTAVAASAASTNLFGTKPNITDSTPASNPFGFGSGTGAASSNTPNVLPTKPSGNTSGFGGSGSGDSGSGDAPKPAKATFVFGKSAFGTTTAPSAGSVFGTPGPSKSADNNTSATTPSGNTSVFGGSGSGDSGNGDAPKPAKATFVFGKSAFNMANSPFSTTAPSVGTETGSVFGTPDSSKPVKNTPVFGSTSTFGTSTPSSTAQHASTSGAQSTPTFPFNSAQAPSSNTSTPIFGFSSQPATNNGTTSTPSAFGNSGQQPTPSMFGFGNPSTTTNPFNSTTSSNSEQKQNQ